MPEIENAIVQHTQNWIKDVVIGCNFCPFAAREFNTNSIRYIVVQNADLDSLKTTLIEEFQLLDADTKTTTTLLIFPNQFQTFDAFLNVLEYAEDILKWNQYEGIYQLASFHPQYLFEGESPESPTHYTNRSPYAMLHILREDMVEKAIDKFPHYMEKIPEDNIMFCNDKGIAFMKALWERSFG